MTIVNPVVRAPNLMKAPGKRPIISRSTIPPLVDVRPGSVGHRLRTSVQHRAYPASIVAERKRAHTDVAVGGAAGRRRHRILVGPVANEPRQPLEFRCAQRPQRCQHLLVQGCHLSRRIVAGPPHNDNALGKQTFNQTHARMIALPLRAVGIAQKNYR
jgi:hypothetical protein